MHTPDFAAEKSTTVRPLAGSASPGSHWIVEHCPRLAALVLAELFVAPRNRVKPFELPVGATTEMLHAGKHIVPVHLVGEGPLVVLLHDWQGGSSQLSRLAQGLANAGLLMHWFGDSLDGTVARYRQAERPRYGFFVDQTIDVVGNLLIALGVGLSPWARLDVALLFLTAFHMISICSLIVSS